MDQKHSMLYPPIEPNAGTMAQEQRISASASIGLPIEAPPTYDMAMASNTPVSPRSTVNSVIYQQATSSGVSVLPYDPQIQSNQSSPHTSAHVVTVQPTPGNTVNAASPISSPTQTGDLRLGPHPCAVTCPACGERNTSRVNYTSNSRTHIYALILCIVGWYCCACCVPYCMTSCRTGNHYCNKCNTFLGAYTRRYRRK